MDIGSPISLNIQAGQRHKRMRMNQGWLILGWNGWVFVLHSPFEDLLWTQSYWQGNQLTDLQVISFLTPHQTRELSPQLPLNWPPFMRIIEFIDDSIGGEGGIFCTTAQSDWKIHFIKLMKNPFVQINFLTGSHTGIAESKASAFHILKYEI